MYNNIDYSKPTINILLLNGMPNKHICPFYLEIISENDEKCGH